MKTIGYERSGVDESEEAICDEDLVSPHIQPWLTKQLGTPLSPLCWHVIREYILLDFRDYQLDPLAWEPEEQELLLKKVREIWRLCKMEMKQAIHKRELLWKSGKEAASSTARSTSGTQEAPEPFELSDADLSQLFGSQSRVDQGYAKAAEKRAAAAVQVGDLRALLRDNEVACAEAIANYYAALLTLSPVVQAFWREVLGNRLLTNEEADRWILSPLPRFLTRRELAPYVMQEPPLSQSSDSGDLGNLDVLPVAEVVSWELGMISGQQAEQQKQSPGVVFAPPQVPMRSFEWNEYLYSTFTVTLRVETSSKTCTLREGEGNDDIERTLITHKDGLLWASLFPKDTSLGDSDVTFPRLFPGSVADELGRIARGFALTLPFAPEQIARFLLTGEGIEYAPVRVATKEPATIVARRMLAAGRAAGEVATAAATSGQIGSAREEQRRFANVFIHRLQLPAIDASLSGSGFASGFTSELESSPSVEAVNMRSYGVRGYIRLEAEPWISAETIEAHWRHLQAQVLQVPQTDSDLQDTIDTAAGVLDVAKAAERTSPKQKQRKRRLHPTHRGESVQAAGLVSYMSYRIRASVGAKTGKAGASAKNLPTFYKVHQRLNQQFGIPSRSESRQEDKTVATTAIGNIRSGGPNSMEDITEKATTVCLPPDKQEISKEETLVTGTLGATGLSSIMRLGMDMPSLNLHGYKHFSVFLKVYRQACQALDLPEDISEISAHLWKRLEMR